MWNVKSNILTIITGNIFSISFQNHKVNFYPLCGIVPSDRHGAVGRPPSGQRPPSSPRGRVCSWGGGGPCSPGKSGYPPVRTSSGGHCSGRYASYWDAFLFLWFLSHSAMYSWCQCISSTVKRMFCMSILIKLRLFPDNIQSLSTLA